MTRYCKQALRRIRSPLLAGWDLNAHQYYDLQLESFVPHLSLVCSTMKSATAGPTNFVAAPVQCPSTGKNSFSLPGYVARIGVTARAPEKPELSAACAKC